MIYMRIHKAADDIILAACDEEVLGKTFSGDGMKIHVSNGFYDGYLVTEEEFVDQLDGYTIMNLVGDRVIALAIENGHVSEDCIIEIGEVKHAQVVKL